MLSSGLSLMMYSSAKVLQISVPQTRRQCAQAVIRGGSWGDYPQDLRAAVRSRFGPSNRFNAIGFRLVQDINP